MPERIQLRRIKGWRKPDGAVVVARPTKWGNDFPVGQHCDMTIGGTRSTFRVTSAEQAVRLFEQWQAPELAAAARRELAGKDLACWCPLDRPCHADVLLRLANEESQP